jgi:hypothetical protein
MVNSSIKRFQALPIAFLFCAISLGAAAEQWTPPQNPDPEEIRRGADKNAREKRYDLASQKYVWYHENALKYQPALVGVRVSFALMGWRSLANQYPPALEDMRRAQDKAEERVKSNNDDASAFETIGKIKGLMSFQDAAALNRILRENNRTIELFKWLDEQDPDFAHRVFVIAQDALVDAGEYALCETYLTGRNSFSEILDNHQKQIGLMEQLYGGAENAPHIDSNYMTFTRRAAYIVAILVNRDRLSDAKIIAEKAMRELENENLRNQIGDALRGVPPKQLM